MAFLSFYTLKGFKIDYLLNLNITEKMFNGCNNGIRNRKNK